MRLRRNCTNDEEFFLQAGVLTERFLEKGYELGTLNQVLQQVSSIDRQSLLTTRPKKEHQDQVAFVSGFHRQYKQVESIFKRFWPILLKDIDLRSTIAPKPKFINRRASGLRNKIAMNLPDPPRKPPTFLDGSRFHFCTKVKACRTTRKSGAPQKISHFQSTVTQDSFKIKPLITCNSDHVTYVLECPCSICRLNNTTA